MSHVCTVMFQCCCFQWFVAVFICLYIKNMVQLHVRILLQCLHSASCQLIVDRTGSCVGGDGR